MRITYALTCTLAALAALTSFGDDRVQDILSGKIIEPGKSIVTTNSTARPLRIAAVHGQYETTQNGELAFGIYGPGTVTNYYRRFLFFGKKQVSVDSASLGKAYWIPVGHFHIITNGAPVSFTNVYVTIEVDRK